jgi:phage protein U
MADVTVPKQNKGWNKVAILSIILWLGIVFIQDKVLIAGLLLPVVLVGGIMSYGQIKKTGEKGKTLSLIVIFLGGLGTLAIVLPMLLIAIRG